MTTADRRVDVGGQAVIEGVMMRSPRSFAVVCRRPDGAIVVKEAAWEPLWSRMRVLRAPFLRGAIVLLESLWNGLSALSFAADQQTIETSTPAGPPPQSLGAAAAGSSGSPDTSDKVAKILTLTLSLALGLAFFVGVPHLLAWALGSVLGFDTASVWFHLVDGVVKTLLLLGYLSAISRIPEIRRVFEYHGAEHKAIATYEHGLELTVANARTQSRFHPRCGTSFLLIVVLVSVALFTALLRGQWMPTPAMDHAAKILIKLPLMFPIAGLAYELIRLAGKKCDTSALARALSAPGMWLQKITTREPADDQLEIALISIRKTLWRERLGAAATVGAPVAVYASAADVDLPLI